MNISIMKYWNQSFFVATQLNSMSKWAIFKYLFAPGPNWYKSLCIFLTCINIAWKWQNIAQKNGKMPKMVKNRSKWSEMLKPHLTPYLRPLCTFFKKDFTFFKKILPFVKKILLFFKKILLFSKEILLFSREIFLFFKKILLFYFFSRRFTFLKNIWLFSKKILLFSQRTFFFQKSKIPSKIYIWQLNFFNN